MPRFTRDQVVSRRRLLAGGVAAVVGAMAVGEAAHRALIPGARALDRLAPTCWATNCEGPGESVSGSFYSTFRRTTVGYTVGYPEGHGPGSPLPLIVMLHGFGGDHTTVPAGLSPGAAVSMTVGGRRLTPMAMVTVDGGGGYWHPHPRDDPMGMVVHELIPMLQRRGLGVHPHRIATMGISMGGFGAIAIAEHHPRLVAAVAAISPAIFTTYGWVHYVNPGAYWSAGDFARYAAITHAAGLRGIPVRVASGLHDPFHPWVEDLVAALPPGAVAVYPPGGHTGSFFESEQPPSLAFLAAQLST